MRRAASLRHPEFRASVIAAHLRGEYEVAAAARILAVSPRRFRQLRARYEAEGAKALVNGLRGRRSNRAIKTAIRIPIIALLRSRYRGLPPTCISRQLKRDEDLIVSVHTIRAWMIAEGLWQVRPRVGNVRPRKTVRPVPATAHGPLLARIADWKETEQHFIDIAIAYIAASDRPVPDDELVAHVMRVDPELLQKLALIDAIRAHDEALAPRNSVELGREDGQ